MSQFFIQGTGGGGGGGSSTNTVTTSVANGNDGINVPILTVTNPGTPGVYRLETRVAAFDITDTAGAGYEVFGTVRSTGAATVLIGVPFDDSDEEAAMAAGKVSITVAGNSWSVTVKGPAGKTVDWKSDTSWTFVS